MAVEYQQGLEKIVAAHETLQRQVTELSLEFKAYRASLEALVIRHDRILMGHNGQDGMLIWMDRLVQGNLLARVGSMERAYLRLALIGSVVVLFGVPTINYLIQLWLGHR